MHYSADQVWKLLLFSSGSPYNIFLNNIDMQYVTQTLYLVLSALENVYVLCRFSVS